MKSNIIRRTLFLIALSFFITFSACSSHDRTTTQSTESISYDTNTGAQEKTVTTTSTSSDVDNDDGCGGVLSCTVGFLGDVIALPFRAVGALVDLVF